MVPAAACKILRDHLAGAAAGTGEAVGAGVAGAVPAVEGGAAWAAAAAGFFASTASEIEAGIGFVFSVKLSNGMITRKKPK